jgi:hypothetical protein
VMLQSRNSWWLLRETLHVLIVSCRYCDDLVYNMLQRIEMLQRQVMMLRRVIVTSADGDDGA